MSKAKDVFIKKIKKNSSDIDSILRLFKDNKVEEALRIVLKTIPKRERVKYLTDAFYSSKYRAYAAGMSRFKYTMDRYINYDDKESLKVYEQEISAQEKENPSNINNSQFNAIRRYIMLEALGSGHSNCAMPALELLSDVNNFIPDENLLKKHLANLIEIKWPDHPGIKILFGSK